MARNRRLAPAYEGLSPRLNRQRGRTTRYRRLRVLRLLRTLRVVLLQDSVILRQRFPLHPLWMDPLFNGEEYRRFAGRVEDSLVHVVTSDELTIQKYWPAHDAVAIPRHEAAIPRSKRRPETRFPKSYGRFQTGSTRWRSCPRRRLRPRSRRLPWRHPCPYGSSRGRRESGSGLPRQYDRLRLSPGLFKSPFRSSRRRLGLSLTWDILHHRRRRQTWIP
jgi:Centromere DNA-binding protein complex CBF3 subunit, domain 2